jgi:2-keto-4-pentenoate hydratase/2-oxohepta-3-ene-1,7-dioic acid hydratase in catechol pathway
LKLVMFEAHQQARLGVLEAGMIVDLACAHELCRSKLRGNVRPPETFPQTIIDFVELGEDIKEYVSELATHARGLVGESPSEGNQSMLWSIHGVRVLPPVPCPPKIVCVGLNYRDHAEEAQVPIPDRPILFSKPSTAIIGPDDPVVYPRISSQVDHEVELAVIIGKGGKDVAESEAFDHVAGYTVFNDISARDIQFADKQWFRGKSFDTFAPTGPYLVLKDQVIDPVT